MSRLNATVHLHSPSRLAAPVSVFVAAVIVTAVAACADLPARTAQGDKVETTSPEKVKESAATGRADATAASGGAGNKSATVAATGQIPPVVPPTGAAPGALPFGMPGATPEPKRYDQVITKDAKTSKGLVLHCGPRPRLRQTAWQQ